MKKFIYILILLISCSIAEAKNPEWLTYNFYDFWISESLINITFDHQDNAWIVSVNGHYLRKGGLLKFDRTNWTTWQPDNSTLQSSLLTDIAIDKNNNFWITTVDTGLIKFDGKNFNLVPLPRNSLPSGYITLSDIAIDNNNVKWIVSQYLWGGELLNYNNQKWQVFDTTNSPIPNNAYAYAVSVFVDKNNNKWIGLNFLNSKIFKYDDKNWTVYDTLSKRKYKNDINAFAEDSLGNMWIGWKYPVKFDGKNWTIFTDCPMTDILSIAVENDSIIWGSAYSPDNPHLKTGGGLVKYQNGNWTVWDSTNSPLLGAPSSIQIDKYGNKWMVYGVGLVIFREGGVLGITDVKEDREVAQNKILCYPNPTSGIITLRYRIESAGQSSIILTNALGNQRILKSEYKFPGDYIEIFNLNSTSQGMYNIILQSAGKVYALKIAVVK